MKTQEFLKKLENSRLSVFSLSDLSKILGKGESYTKVYLHRLSKKQLVRIEKNKYVLKGTNPLLVASNLVFPSYISFLTAYSYYGMTNQLPRICWVVSLKQKKSLKYDGCSIRFVKFRREKFFGFRKESVEGKFLFIAEPEKAVVDSLYIPRYCPVSETFFALKNGDLNKEKLFSYAEKMNLAVVQRLGFLLELLGMKIKPKKRFSNYVFLNPSLPRKGKKNKKWKVIVNEVLE